MHPNMNSIKRSKFYITSRNSQLRAVRSLAVLISQGRNITEGRPLTTLSRGERVRWLNP